MISLCVRQLRAVAGSSLRRVPLPIKRAVVKVAHKLLQKGVQLTALRDAGPSPAAQKHGDTEASAAPAEVARLQAQLKGQRAQKEQLFIDNITLSDQLSARDVLAAHQLDLICALTNSLAACKLELAKAKQQHSAASSEAERARAQTRALRAKKQEELDALRDHMGQLLADHCKQVCELEEQREVRQGHEASIACLTAALEERAGKAAAERLARRSLRDSMELEACRAENERLTWDNAALSAGKANLEAAYQDVRAQAGTRISTQAQEIISLQATLEFAAARVQEADTKYWELCATAAQMVQDRQQQVSIAQAQASAATQIADAAVFAYGGMQARFEGLLQLSAETAAQLPRSAEMALWWEEQRPALHERLEQLGLSCC